ncbi:hypothetical protein F5Y18DRAFT_320753 [Xylariaceae sp. FL1019]|nr:hypothetical protein F5Y18DRAFT_320753 [Xylariaceae sp. FL1019]
MSSEGFVYSDVNLGDPLPNSNRPDTVYASVITLISLAWICVLFRLYVRFWVVKAPGLDDVCVIAYLLSTTLVSISVVVSVQYGLGKHFLLLEAWELHGFLKVFYAGNIGYISSTCLIKLALLFQYLRVFDRGVLKRRLIQMLITITSLWGTAYTLLAILPCWPVYEFWLASATAKCWGYGAHTPKPFVATYISHAATNMILDTIVFLIPVHLIFKEGTGTPTRLRLMGLLIIGVIVIGIATARLYTIVDHRATSYPTRDPTWYAPISLLLAVAEIVAAAICASIPIFWPVLTMHWGRIFVTKEINITHEARFTDDDEDGLTRGTSHSRSASDQISDGFNSMSKTKAAYYKDSYVLTQVDPLRLKSTQINGGTQITGGSIREHVKDRGREWVKI